MVVTELKKLGNLPVTGPDFMVCDVILVLSLN